MQTLFYKIVEVPNANAGNLFNAIESNFEHDGIPFKNLIGFGSDGASVMRGTHNSVLSRLKEKQPDIFFLHCICHSDICVLQVHAKSSHGMLKN